MTDSFGKESGGNTQSDQRPSGWLNAPSGRRSKYAVLNSVPSQVNSDDSASDCVVSAIAPAVLSTVFDRSASTLSTQNSTSPCSRVMWPILASKARPSEEPGCDSGGSKDLRHSPIT